EMEQFCIRFIATLRTLTIDAIEQRGRVVYHDVPGQPSPSHFLGYHHAVHLAMHWGQIRSLRNLYRTSRGEQALFFPDNPTFPTPSTSNPLCFVMSALHLPCPCPSSLPWAGWTRHSGVSRCSRYSGSWSPAASWPAGCRGRRHCGGLAKS